MGTPDLLCHDTRDKRKLSRAALPIDRETDSAPILYNLLAVTAASAVGQLGVEGKGERAVQRPRVPPRPGKGPGDLYMMNKES